MQEFTPKSMYLQQRGNVVVDSLSRHVPLGTMAEKLSVVEKFIMHESVMDKREHDVWRFR